MVPGHPTRNDRVKGLDMSRDPCRDTGKIGATGGTQDTNMFGLGGEGKGFSVHCDGIGVQPILSRVVTLGLVKQQLGLLRDVDHAPGGG